MDSSHEKPQATPAHQAALGDRATGDAGLEHYARLLKEAQEIKGVSLGSDAWRRLRKSRVAMVSLWGLVVLVLLAFFTPLLPLQPPQKVATDQRYAEPRLWPVFERSLTLRERLEKVPEQLAAANVQLQEARDEIAWTAEKIQQEGERLGERAKELEQSRKELRDAEEALRLAQARVEEGSGDYTEDVKQYQRAEREYRLAKRYFEWISEATTWTAGDVSWAKQIASKNQEEVARHRMQLAAIAQEPYRQEGFGRVNALSRWMILARVKLFGDWSVASLLGRDELGRDVLSRLFWGARISLIVGLVATLVSLVIGVSYGAISGYLGDWADDAMMRLVDILYSIPFIFVVIYLITVLDEFKPSLEAYGIDRITIFYVVVGAIYWLTMARVVRGQVISLKNEQFIEAARVIGASRARIIFNHLVPNLMSVIIVYLTLTIPRVMLFEAFLSFLGLGVEPPDVSWGLMANEGIRVITPVVIYWWLIVFPGLALGATLFALNFLGDGLRDALDPRMKNR